MDKNDLNGMKSDDRLKLKTLYHQFRDEFIGFGKRYNLGQDALADIYQESFLALRKRALQGKLDAVESSMKTYLFGIGKFKIFDALKAKRQEVPYETRLHMAGEEIPEVEIGVEPQLTERQQLLRKYLKQLGENCREVLTMFYYRGLSIAEICEQKKYRNENVVKAHESRCLKTLKQLCNS